MDIQGLEKEQQQSELKEKQVVLKEKVEEKAVKNQDGLDQSLEVKEQKQLAKGAAANQDISAAGLNAMAEILKNGHEAVEEAKAEVLDLEHLDDAYIDGLSKDETKSLIEAISNSKELSEQEEMKLLVKMLIFELSQNGTKETRGGLEVKKALERRLGAESVADKPLFVTLRKSIQKYYSNTVTEKYVKPSLGDYALIKGTAALGKAEIIDLKKARTSFFAEIDDNPVYDKEDQLIRKLEYYRTYEKDMMKIGAGSDAPTVELEKVRYRYEMDLLEKELADFRTKKALYNKVVAELERQLAECEEGSYAYQEISKKIGDLHTLDEFKGISLLKNNVLSLDQTTEEVKYREGDSTLHPSQIDAVHELDKWMFSQAKDAYKDKNFMSQLMGCTMRERMAIYLCVEMDKTSLDDAMLAFSQANYMPDIKKIQKNLIGLNPFRRAGWQRIRWGSVRGAFEFVAKKSTEIGQLARWAKEGEEEANLNQDKSLKDEELFIPNGEGTAILKDKAKDEASKAAAEAYVGEELDTKVCEYSAKVLRAIAKMQKGIANRNEVSNEMKDDVKMLRALVERKADLSKDCGVRKVWNNFQTAVSAIDYLNMGYGALVGASSLLRTAEIVNETDKTGIWLDGSDYTGLYTGSAVSLLRSMRGAFGLFEMGYKRESSGSAVLKAVLAEMSELNTLVSSSHLAVSITGEYGTWAGGYRQYRNKFYGDMNERIEKGMSAAEFDTSKAVVRYQLIGSAITVGSATVDLYNIGRSTLASRTIKKKCQNRQKRAGMVDKQYREKVYQNSLAKLTNRLDARKGVTVSANLLSNASGYAKYFLPTALVGTVGSIALSILPVGIDMFLKSRSDKKTVDDFIDLDAHIADYKAKHPEVDVTTKEFRKQLRKKIILQLGFANTKTFFSHVAERLGTMIHNVLKDAKEGNQEKRKQAEPFATIVKAMGLRVNYDLDKIPSPKQISDKLAA